MYHDGSSGGVVRIGIINEDGIERKVFFNTESGEAVVAGQWEASKQLINFAPN